VKQRFLKKRGVLQQYSTLINILYSTSTIQDEKIVDSFDQGKKEEGFTI
jgi:hypothetical protein